MPTRGQAWQIRDSQRDKFVERMMRMIDQQEEAQDDNGYFSEDLLLALITLVAEMRAGGKVPRYRRFRETQTLAIKLLIQEILMEARVFSRAPEETTHLLQNIAQNLMGSLGRKTGQALQDKQRSETRTVLGADRETDEIELPED